MKRLIPLLLVLILALSLTACAVSVPGVPKGSKTPETKAPETAAPTTAAPTTAAPTTEAPTTEAPTTETPATEPPAPETTEAKNDLPIRGSADKRAYVNQYLNLNITLPTGWTFYTEEQIAQVNSVTAQALENTDVAELIAKSGQFIDMLCSDVSGNNINLVIQPSQAVLDNYTDLQIFQLSEATITAQMQAAGMELLYYDPMTAQIDGEDHDALHMVLKIGGVDVEEFQFWFREGGDYMGVLTITLSGNMDLQDVLSCITRLN